MTKISSSVFARTALLVIFMFIGGASAFAATTTAPPTGTIAKIKAQFANSKATISQNIVNNIGGIRGFAMGFGALLGLFIFIGALLAVNKQVSNPNNQQGGGYGLAVAGIVVGVALMNLWITVGAFSTTTFGNSFSWVKSGTGAAAQYGAGQITVLAAAMWLQVIGIFMTIHGLSLYTKVGKSQDATIGKASAHFIGGILLSNILITTNLVTGFTGFKNPFALLGIA